MNEAVEREQVDRIVAVLVALEPGEVTTYGDVASVAGVPGRARFVGRVLAHSEEWVADAELPWWRVVTASGRLVPGNEREHAALLRSEGVTVRDGHVVAAPVGRFAARPGQAGSLSRRRPTRRSSPPGQRDGPTRDGRSTRGLA